jgi:hypothetical protein
MVCVEDYAWLLGLTAPGRLAGSRRRLAQEGLAATDVERGVTTIERALAADGPLTRRELAERIEREGIRTAGQAIVHLIGLSALHGIAIPAATCTDHHSLALTDDWLGSRPPTELRGEDRDAALAELARRYLIGHGPAADRDLAKWSGLGLRDARRGLARIAGELVDLGGGLVDLRSREPSTLPLDPVLLPSFDPYMLGWDDRTFAVAAGHVRRVHPGGGMLRAVACDDGLAIGTWSARRGEGTLAVRVEPFHPHEDVPVELEPLHPRDDVPVNVEPVGHLEQRVSHGLRTEAADVARFEGRRLV